MAEAWFNRPMEVADVQPSDPPVITVCDCKRQLVTTGGVWECPAHGNVYEEEYVIFIAKEGDLDDPCPHCDSYRVARDYVMGYAECFNCFESWEWD